MTKDDDFKRIVRREARERGERYTEAKARLEDARSGHNRDGWAILWTVPGAEAQVRRWLVRRPALGVTDALVPRFKQRKLSPGMLLVRLDEGADVSALASQSFVTGYVGTKAPDLLSWNAVRRELVTQARLTARRPTLDDWPTRLTL